MGKNDISYSLSGLDIMKLANVPVHTLSEVYDHDLRNIVNEDGVVVLLVETTGSDYGHWVTVIYNPPNLEFFDSLGQPDAKNGLDLGIMSRSDYYRQNALPHRDMALTEFLTRDPDIQRVYYTSKDNSLQDNQVGINTCGRWAAMRAMFSDLSHDEFVELFKNISDKKIVKLTQGLF